jgi:lipoprotein-releasing system ATP-binding protein
VKRTSDATIDIRNITKTFPAAQGRDKTLVVLRGVSLKIRGGEIVAVVGASGAGKSTLLHIIGTLEKPTTGTVFYEGTDPFSLGEEALAHFRNQHIGFVFQFHHLLPEFTALENVAMPALIRGKKLSDVTPMAADLLREVGLESRMHEKPFTLSGGEQQRVAVARALINNPRVVLADEPSGNLDSENARNLHKLIWNLSRGRSQTFVIVTHNEGLAREADRAVRIADGVIQQGVSW